MNIQNTHMRINKYIIEQKQLSQLSYRGSIDAFIHTTSLIHLSPNSSKSVPYKISYYPPLSSRHSPLSKFSSLSVVSAHNWLPNT